jgi:hypothetical protein
MEFPSLIFMGPIQAQDLNPIRKKKLPIPIFNIHQTGEKKPIKPSIIIIICLIAYTTESNCAHLAAGFTTQCLTCWDGYYWNTTVYKLSAKLLRAAFLAIVGLFVN